ncbi:MAG: hypothetical protein FWD01_04800 [Defluviitaleaceae bacterium]|nr:hypothetical protein [Defluviitaleaceae bacterium]
MGTFAVFAFSLMFFGGVGFIATFFSFFANYYRPDTIFIIFMAVSGIIWMTGNILWIIRLIIKNKNKQEGNKEIVIPKKELTITAILLLFLGGSGLIIIFLSYHGGIFETINGGLVGFIFFSGVGLMTGIFLSIIMLIIRNKDKSNAKNKNISK